MMKEKIAEKVSIIIPSYNRAHYIAETLKSVLSQTSPNWECIIVDDGSTDNSREIIEKYIKSDHRFKLFFREREPKGACTCRNIGVEKSTGEYLIFLDTDDLLAPYCIEQRLNAMTEDLDFAIFPSLLFRDKPYDLNLWWNIDKSVSELERQFNHDAICQGTGPLFRKESFIKMGKWNENLLIWQDIDLFFNAYIRDFRYKKFFNLPPDLHIRRYEKSISREGYYELAKIQSREIVLRNAYKLLIDNQKENYIDNLKLFAYEVANSYIISKNHKYGKTYITWLFDNNIISKKDLYRIKIVKLIVKLRITRFTKRIMKKLNSYYEYPTTLGKIKYKDTHEGETINR